MRLSLNFLFFFLIAVAISSCDKDPEIPNEEELITTLTYTLTPVAGGDTVMLIFKDLDGEGGEAPTITSEPLQSNTTYIGGVVLLNESEDTVEDITEEVKEEDKDHQFFYTSTTEGVSISYNDSDADGNPIGLKTTLTTGSAGSGSLTIVLRHEPNKSAEGVSDGNIANAGGETDIEVTFSLDVQ